MFFFFFERLKFPLFFVRLQRPGTCKRFSVKMWAPCREVCFVMKALRDSDSQLTVLIFAESTAPQSLDTEPFQFYPCQPIKPWYKKSYIEEGKSNIIWSIISSIFIHDSTFRQMFVVGQLPRQSLGIGLRCLRTSCCPSSAASNSEKSSVIFQKSLTVKSFGGALWVKSPVDVRVSPTGRKNNKWK